MNISNDELKKLFEQDPTVVKVEVTGDGYHFNVQIVSNHFQGLSTVKRQQWVYGKVKTYITSGSLHALTITALTPEELEKNNG